MRSLLAFGAVIAVGVWLAYAIIDSMLLSTVRSPLHHAPRRLLVADRP